MPLLKADAMSFIAGSFLDPAQLLGLPFVLFRSCATFGLDMMRQAMDFAQEIAKVMI